MNSKWYIGTFLLLFICFGVFQEQVYEPNQEIVLEFIDTSSHNNSIKNTINEVQEKLLEIGVANIAIHKTKKGTLKISYYSAVNVDVIKKALSKKHQLVLNKNPDNHKEDEESSNYSIDVYELTDKEDISNLDDKFIFEIEHRSDRFTINYSLGLSKIIESKENTLFKTAYKANKNNLYIKDYTSYQEPEVRAGPQNYFI
ncbi:hypothetical protein H9I45_14020 [Polaribacter haliotis]|uniref:Uncharacterized protein n=1 Tax=Polaribacter haliotis TaxID=1888915 RepID=A0A7L8AEM6_9FLAO|nr:hypothetical protein [Polaribacter haliotis]QOD60445.1 hypothetical protein H9I45_14020 [Polaribacter haliotis]